VTIQELKQAIVDEVAAIDEDLRRRVYGNFQTRLQQCIDVNRGHLPDVIFRKNITSSVYDCTVEDVEYIYNKLSIHIFNSKRRSFHSNA